MPNQSTITLTIGKSFNVGPEKVFEAWVTPDLMKKWLFTTEPTNQVAKSDPHVGGQWEIVDHREGKDYRAIGKYLELQSPNRLVKTFKMPQFSDTEDTITVEIESTEEGAEMKFEQKIIVPHEKEWSKEDIEKACQEYHDQSKIGWNMMFDGLKQLVETGTIHYPS
ncbi:SRPBCC family protein [Piscibacillus halophilus]|uniref:SRPBCC family protein n=1 Tax=Piscibacillus halophilus TaxID=571933 RepID=UPI00240A883F|nr:SRPBCC domain-containing protein [Piscibacillus halophilus]